MAIEKKEIRDVSASVRNVYQKAVGVIQNQGLDYGIELLKSVVQADPGFMDARKALRDAENVKADSMGGFAKFMANLKANRFILKGRAISSKKPLDAMALAEDALALYLRNSQALSLLADAARNADAMFITIEANETILAMDPENESQINKLLEIYREAHDGAKELAMCQKLLAKHPENLDLQGALREAAARATLSNNWDNRAAGQSAVDMARQKDGEQQQGDKELRDIEDIKAAVLKMEKEIASGSDSLDLYKKIAQYYYQLGRYEDAIKSYDWIVEKMGALDPTIDKNIERANVAIGMQNIENLKASGASAEEIAAQEKEIYDYRLDRYEDRVKNYPNDLMLRYELAELYWEGRNIDKALEQFQIAQKNPQKRLSAIVYLGRCFHEKGQNDMAIEQFDKALSEMPVMDKEKMNTLYYLGITYDNLNQAEKAQDCFKQIYTADVNYRDVKERMDAYYASKK